MSFIKAVTTVGGFTMASRILGLIRDMVTATYLGATPASDAFFIALKLPNIFRRITAEGAFSYSFVPLFAKMLHDKKDAKQFAEEAQAMMIITLLPFTIVALVLMPWILYVIVPGLVDDPVRFGYAVEFSRVTFPYILMISLTSLLGGVMNSLNRFAAFAIAPIFFNLCMIISVVAFNGYFENSGQALSYGVLSAGFVQFLWMLYNAHKAGFALKLRKPSISPRIKKLFKLMVPGLLGAFVTQANMFIDMILTSLLPVGSISYLYYADRLYELPLGVIGIAISTALLPMLSKSIRDNDGTSKKLSTNAFEVALTLALPAAVGLIVLAEPIITVLFERGQFDHTDTLQSAIALKAYCIGIPAYILARLFSTCYFARENTKTPVKFAIITAVINTIMAFILIHPFKHVGISMASGICAWINLSLLVTGLKRRGHLEIDMGALKKAGKIVLCALITGLAAYSYYFINYDINIMIKLGAVIALSGITYFLSLYFFGIFNLLSIKKVFAKGKAS